MRTIARAWIVLAVALLAPAAAYAQASITGTVKDSSGAVLPGVTVEAASDVLIEKVRTAVTDSNGRYQLVDLRPGVYVVTFSLTGFNSFKREGVTLSGSAATNLDADLRVGALEETITVTGEAPVVDTRTLTQQRVLTSDIVDALPSARNYTTLARMIPGTIASGNGASDVGGSQIQDVGGSVTVHGSKTTDQRVTVNGVNTMTLQAGGNIGGQTPDVGSAAEVTVDTTSLSAELPTGGVRINFIPRDGGNRFSDSTFLTFSNESMQGDNYSDKLKAAGLATPNKIVKNFDINESFGGPIRRDKVWFWFSSRYNTVENKAAIFRNVNEFKPNEWLYVADTSSQGVNKGEQLNSSVRVTYQVTPKVKVAGTYKADRWCNCPSNISANVAPEAARDRRFPRLRQEHGEVTSPITNRLLFEAVGLHLYERWGNMHLRPSTGSISEDQSAILPQMISVLEQTGNVRYRALDVYNNTVVPDWTYRAAVSYVTGTHAFKLGFNGTNGYQKEYNYALNPISYTFSNGAPVQLTLRSTPYRVDTDMRADLGVYAQDRWTMERWTLQGALRFDSFRTGFPEQHAGPATFAPTRDITFPEQSNISWKDLTYRSGVAYDLRGDGKTAIKVAFNKYLLGQTLNGLGRDPNPMLTLQTQTNRSWNDRGGLGINNDYIPQCDLLNPLANGECGPFSNTAFNTSTPADVFDPDLISGWNHRQSNWELTAGVQHEVLPRVALDVGYFRRIWKNFRVTDNVLVGPEDFTQFSVTVPNDPNLGETAGKTLTGFYNVVPTKFGQTRNLNALSDKYGKQIEHWNGFDVNVNARLQNGLTMQAGVSSGKTVEDNCEVVAKLPEMLQLTAANASNTAGGVANQWRPAQFCHREEPILTQFKGYGVYTVPKIDVQVSGTFRSTTGTSLSAAFTATNAYLAANSTLGRALSGNAANVILGVAEPNQLFTQRRNELDMRIGKVVRLNKTRSVISLDMFNALNSDAIVTQTQAYVLPTPAWLRPTEVLNARLLKVSWAFDF
jgi:hypothetical protein